MKILYVTNACPWPSTAGGLLRDAQFVSHLCLSHHVKLIVLGQPNNIPVDGIPCEIDYRPYSYATRSLPTGLWAKRLSSLKDAIKPSSRLATLYSDTSLRMVFASLAAHARSFDIVWISRGFFASHALAVGFGGRLVVDFVDVEWASQRSQLASLPSTPYKLLSIYDTYKLARFERRIAKAVWRNVVCKPEDAVLLGNRLSNVYVVPNGTAVHDPAPPADAQEGNILFVGLMGYAPNQDAVAWFGRDILPRIEDTAQTLKVDIVGGNPSPDILALQRFDRRIIVHGFVPELRSFYIRASIIVCPIRTGSGTRLKVLEALSFGKAVVATSEAVKGIGLRHGVDCLVADSAAEFAHACSRLLADASLRKKLSKSGRDFVVERYSWERVSEHLDRVIQV